MSSDRKRKRIIKPLSLSSQTHHYWSGGRRTLIFCLSSFVFLLFLSSSSDRFSIGSAAFRPVITVSSLSLLSSSASNSIQDSRTKIFPNLRVEDRILFPDHFLLLVVDNRKDKSQGLDCVYYLNSTSSDEVITKPAISSDEYDEFRSIFRCPRISNYTGAVDLRGTKKDEVVGDDWLLLQINQTAVVHSWDAVVYTAALDRETETVVVFVKGLNLRPDRTSDPTQFRCHFGLGNWEKNYLNRNQQFVLSTKALSAAQEIVRCSLPRSIRRNPSKIHGIRVTVAIPHPLPHSNHLRSASPRSASASARVALPSVAKIFTSKPYMQNQRKKYELCACTMVWNQASSLKEWITYHAWLGIERWFIYDNNSDDGINEVIEELDLQNYNVSRHVWPWIKTQEAGFSHCALRAKDECNWVAFMDVDEFFYFPYPTRPRRSELGLPGQNSLRSLVSKFSNSTTIAEIRTACHSFGPSGLTSPPSQGVTAGYTCRLQSPERHKSIVRPNALDRTLLNVVHHFRLKKGFRYMNLRQSIAVINHYKYQVWEAFRAKFYRRVATYVADWQEKENEGSKDRAPGLGTEAIEPPNWPLQFCEVWDTGLRDFVLANLADPVTGLLPWDKSSSSSSSSSSL